MLGVPYPGCMNYQITDAAAFNEVLCIRSFATIPESIDMKVMGMLIEKTTGRFEYDSQSIMHDVAVLHILLPLSAWVTPWRPYWRPGTPCSHTWPRLREDMAAGPGTFALQGVHVCSTECCRRLIKKVTLRNGPARDLKQLYKYWRIPHKGYITSNIVRVLMCNQRQTFETL